nr:NAD(P)-dependent alcohol dehydrogenase [Gordonia sp. KTR9]
MTPEIHGRSACAGQRQRRGPVNDTEEEAHMRTIAALSHGPGTPFVLSEVDLASLQDTEVLVRIEAAGICHTDVSFKEFSAVNSPALYGHEGAGIVEAVGAAVTDVTVGAKVLVSYNSCGTCPQCIAGNRAYCENFLVLNASGSRTDGTSTVSVDGSPVYSSFFGQSSFARHAIATRENVVVVADEVDLTIAAPMGCGFQTGAGSVVNVLRPDSSSAVVVFGAGGVGMAAIMAARAVGAPTVVAVDLSQRRREIALDVGATHVLDGADGNLVDQIVEITGGGATHALDTTAVPTVIASAAAALRALGTLVTVGIGTPEITINIADLINSGKSIRGSIEGDSDPHSMIPLLLAWHGEGKFPVEKLIDVFPFEQINDAITGMRDAVIKPVLTFT